MKGVVNMKASHVTKAAVKVKKQNMSTADTIISMSTANAAVAGVMVAAAGVVSAFSDMVNYAW
ncbi:hypothetical protein Ef18B233LT_33890 [Escherichia fergusonii]|nr:hypothetical protein Ef30038_08650 [Escherichia fergusonii]BES10405.1 hypothetical protein Ef18B006LT_35000 [Escherichia fergusonii]BES12167.1 hypothetical protein Ef18B226LT_07460 [Escherichia fergusonii]BES19559.1 hypothetical protein Ef18B233LT_33890 [Escherichia fergusonii]BES24099.1 hypothetical protein Ef18B269LT_34430 [Escherichia fergusonii]